MIKNQWFLACFEDELKKNSFLKRKISGEEILVFKNEKGEVAALEDRCCHRNVHLSKGQVKGNNLLCCYLGWEFNNEGKCVHIPMLENPSNIPSSACIKSYPLQKKYKAYWVYVGEANKMSEANIPELDELDNYPFVYYAHTLKANIKLVAESLFDAQHINHVHKNSIRTLLGKLREPKTDFTIDMQEKSMHGSYQRINNSSLFEKIYFGWDEYIQTK